MVKKVLAFFLCFITLCGLAFYSGYLYTADEPQNELPGEEEDIGSITKTAEEAVEESSNELLEIDRQETSVGAEDIKAEIEETEELELSDETFSYYLVEEFGYINIYLADQETLYEYTDITIDSLPEELQAEICTGKGMANEQELYDFLENYSS